MLSQPDTLKYEYEPHVLETGLDVTVRESLPVAIFAKTATLIPPVVFCWA